MGALSEDHPGKTGRTCTKNAGIRQHKKNRKNPNDPARFTETTAATEDGKAADIHNYLNENKIYEECFRIMKTDFSARPVYLQDENREIKHLYSHFGCFISRSPVSFCHK